MHRLVVLGLVAACKPAAPVPPTASGPPYLALFEAGRAWTLPIEVTTGQIAPPIADKIERGAVTCSASNLRRVGDANLVTLACAKPYDDLLIAGTWVAAPAGLYHPAIPIDGPDELAMLTDDDLLLNAIPAERDHSHAVAATEEHVEAWPFERAWCVKDTTSASPDQRSFTLCFDGHGISGGTDLVIVGLERAWHLARFGKAPADPDANGQIEP